MTYAADERRPGAGPLPQPPTRCRRGPQPWRRSSHRDASSCG